MLVWQPVWVYAEVAANALPVASQQWVQQGQATRIEKNAVMDIDVSDRVSLRWDSFNIGRDATVNFNQPNSGSIALNRVGSGGDAAASQIMGKLNANGRVYLLDRNGVIFGPESKVNVASLIASSLDLNPALEAKLMDPNSSIADAIKESQAAFSSTGQAGNPDAQIVLEGGASIQTTEGGQVYLFAPHIKTEAGSSIHTPGGQTIMAASSDDVYLAASTDPDLRGMLVEVKTGGDIQHAGEVVAERGNITLAALAINQQGTLKATTSVDANGTIRLLARDGATVEASKLGGSDEDDATRFAILAGVLNADGEVESTMDRIGTQDVLLPVASNTAERGAVAQAGVVFASGSVTRITPDQSTKTAQDTNGQAPSFIEVMGKNIDAESGAAIIATGGTIQMTATTSPSNALPAEGIDDSSRLTLHTGSLLDVSGATTAVVDMERNSLEVELRGSELADSPIQRNDPDVRGQTAYVDLRYGDSIEFADISGYVAKIERTADERLASGGKVNLYSEGSVDFQQGAEVDISGGSVQFNAGHIKESRLVSNGESFQISAADPDRNYDAVINPGEYYNQRWNLVQQYKTPDGREQSGVWVDAYTDGRDAGAFNITSRNVNYDGNVSADVIVGPYQRRSSVDGGSIRFDNTRFINASQSILLTSETEFRKNLEQNTQQSPTADLTRISVDRFKNSADSVTLKTAGDLTLDQNTTLVLDGGGTLSLQGRNVSIDSDIQNQAGNVELIAKNTTPSLDVPLIRVANNVAINTSSQWVNDAVGRSVNPTGAIRIDGGDITLNSAGSVSVGDGALLAANGGAWRNVAGDIAGGKGGDIQITLGEFTNTTPVPVLDFRGTATSYSLVQGGELAVDAAGFVVADGRGGVDANGRVGLDTDWFQQGGFSDYSLNAKLSGIEIADGTQLDLQGARYQLTDKNFMQAPSGTTVEQLFTVMPSDAFPAYQRPAVSFALNSTQANKIPASYGLDGIRVGAGAAITTQPGARVQMNATGGDIRIDGKIVALGGDIALQVRTDPGSANFDPSLAVRLGENSVLDVSATSVEKPAPAGLRDSDLYDAGTISLDVGSGYVLAAQGSVMRADGASTTISQYHSTHRRYESTLVDLDAGTIAIRASEGIILDGAMSAQRAGTGRGGDLAIDLNSIDRKPAGINENLVGFTEYPLTIRVGEFDPLMDGALQSAMDLRQAVTSAGLDNGVAYLDVDRINQGGFASISLTTQRNQSSVEKQPSIHFDTDKALVAQESIRLVTPLITVAGHDARVEAPYIAMGTEYSRDLDWMSVTSDLNPRGSFTASGEFLDLTGSLTFSDAEKVTLDSQGDIRLRGSVVAIGDRDLPKGQLVVAQDLDLVAGQVYTSTLSDFTVKAADTITVRDRADASEQARPQHAVLSAGSHLTLDANAIVQDGVVKAPFGSIDFNANSIELHDGSLTSVSGQNQTVLMGTVDGVGDWQYGLKEGEPVIVDTPEEKSIRFTSAAIDHQEGAVVNVSGGGDLLAYYFVSGPNGTTDVLSYGSEGSAGTSFAILPMSENAWGAYDTLEMKDFPYAVGDTVRFENIPGLNPATEYAILPARYALLPGALLVTPVASRLSPGSQRTDLKGASIVAGQFSHASGTDLSAQWQNFLIEPGSAALDRSEIRLFSANSYFTANRPVDGGRIVYDAASAGVAALNIDGSIMAAAAVGGLGGRLDINANNIQVVTTKSATDTATQLTDGQLESLNVDSILLGGTRDATDGEQSIAVGANTVEVQSGVDLSVSELLLVAKDSVTVRNGATISANRSGNTRGGDVTVSGTTGALLQASSGEALVIERGTTSTSKGSLVIEQGATVDSKGALVLDSTRATQLAGDINTQGTLAINSNRITLGGDVTANDSTTLTTAILNDLDARELRLFGRESVNVLSDIDLDLTRMVVDTRMFAAGGDTPVTATIDVQDAFVFRNSASTAGALSATTVAGSELNLTAKEIFLGGADDRSVQLQLAGFDQVSLTGTDQIRAEGRVDLNTVGDAHLSTPRITSAAGSDLGIHAGGNLTLDSVSGGTAKTVTSGESFASRYQLSGADVVLDTTLLANSGTIAVTAQNDIRLGENALLDVSGSRFDFDDRAIATDGGSILLTALNGDIVATDSTRLDLSSASADAVSGTLGLSARNGSVTLPAAPIVSRFDTATGGSVSVEVNALPSLADLLPSLQQFAQQQRVYTHNGDLILAAGQSLQSHSVELITDNGKIVIDGTVNAQGDNGGEIGLYASGDVTVGSGAQLLVNANANDEQGGEIVLASQQGLVSLADGSYFNLAGNGSGDGGVLKVEAARDGDQLNFSDGGTEVEGASGIQITGFKRYTLEQGQALDQSVVNSLAKADSTDFMQSMAGKLQAMGGEFSNLLAQVGERLHIRSGVEFYSDQDLVIDGAIDLAAVSEGIDPFSVYLGPDEVADGSPRLDKGDWRYDMGGQIESGIMRFRAAGDIEVNADVSDGFIWTDIYGGLYALQDTPIPYQSWQFDFAAGSSGAQAKALVATDLATGMLTLADQVQVRTGAGDINIQTGSDLVLGDNAAIYSGGSTPYVEWQYGAQVADAGVLNPEADMYFDLFDQTSIGSARIFYPVMGGDIQVNVGGDVVAEGASVPHTDWLFRIADNTTHRYTWGIQYGNFVNGIGALGGGNVDVAAKGSIENLTLAAPTTARQIALYDGQSDVTSLIDVQGGGDIHVEAGGDILAGNYLLGRGELSIQSGGRIGRQQGVTDGVASLIAMGEGQVRIAARNDIEISAIVDQNLVPISFKQTLAQGDPVDERTQFLSNTSADSASVISYAGDIILNPDGSAHQDASAPLPDLIDPYGALPAQVSLAALQGGVSFLGNIGIESHPESSLEILAKGDIAGATDVNVVVGDYQNYLDYRMGNPLSQSNYSAKNYDGYLELLGLQDIADLSNSAAFIDNQPIFSATASPLTIISQDGNLRAIDSGRAAFAFRLPRASRISVGGDIEDAKLWLQNNFDNDISYVRAGGDLRATTFRNEVGAVGVVGSQTNPVIGIGGPGTLLVEVGGNIDLGASGGILSYGDIYNGRLADSGADIIALAGLKSVPDFAAFAQRYMSDAVSVDDASSFIAAMLTSLPASVDEINAILGTDYTSAPGSVNQADHPQALAVALSSSDTRDLNAAQMLFLNLSAPQQLKVASALYAGADPLQQRVLAYRTLQNEVTRAGYEDAVAVDGENLTAQGKGFARGFNAIETLFDPAQVWQGDIALVSSTISSRDGGDVSLLTPGGSIDVGLPKAIPNIKKQAADLGIITSRTGDVQILANDDVLVNQSRIFALDGDVSIWSSRGDIDAGRGSKTAASQDNPRVYWDPALHRFITDYGTVVTGSGIRAESLDPDGAYVNLSAPQGVIDAGDAGIGAANVILAANIIKGADNIDVGGVSIGVPANSGVSASVTAAGNSASGSATGAMDQVGAEAETENDSSRQVAFLTVEIIGLGD